MALTEAEELELLELERQRAMAEGWKPTPKASDVDPSEVLGVSPEEAEQKLASLPPDPMYPRRSSLAGTDASAGQRMAAGTTDVLSLFGRMVASVPSVQRQGPGDTDMTKRLARYANNVARTGGKEGEGAIGWISKQVGDIVRDPATLATLPLDVASFGGISAAKTAGRQGLFQLLKGGAKAAGRSALEGGVSAATHQLENYGQTGQVDVGQALGEVGLSMGAEGSMALGGKLTKAVLEGAGDAANKIVNSYLRPSRRMIAEGYDGKKIAQQLQKHDIFGDTKEILEGAGRRLKEKSAELYEKLNAANATGITLNWKDEVIRAAKNIEDNIDKYPQIAMKPGTLEKAVQQVVGVGDAISGGSGNVDVLTAQKLKHSVGKLGAWLDGQDTSEFTGVEAVADELYHNLRKAIEDASPAGVNAINRDLSELMTIEQAAARRLPVEMRGDALSLGDIIPMSRVGGTAPESLSGIALAGLRRVTKSPRTAEILQAVSPVTDATAAGIGQLAPAAPLTRKAIRQQFRVDPVEEQAQEPDPEVLKRIAGMRR